MMLCESERLVVRPFLPFTVPVTHGRDSPELETVARYPQFAFVGLVSRNHER
jgi:hypothetical protein